MKPKSPLVSRHVPKCGIALGASLALFACSSPEEDAVQRSENALSYPASTFFSVAPKRLLDTRSGSAVQAEGETCVAVTTDGVPSDATAISINVTATDTTASGYLSVYPAGAPRPLVSNLNFSPNQTVASAAIIPVGTGGRICVYNSAGRSHVLVDRSGYFSPSKEGGRFSALSPARAYDSRLVSAAPLPPMTVTKVSASAVGVPKGATAAIVNLTATDVATAGYVTAFPSGEAAPTVSNLNVVPGDTRANLAVVELRDGQFSVLNQTMAHVVVDVVGYFKSGGTGGELLPVEPIRVYDSREAGGKLRQGETRAIQLIKPGMPTGGAALLSLTATEPTSSGFLTVGAVRGLTSTLNFAAHDTVANLAPTWVTADGRGYVFNALGSTHVVADVFGIFDSPPNASPPPIPEIPKTLLKNAVDTLVGELPNRSPGTVMGIASYDFSTGEYAGSLDETPEVSASSAKALWVAAALDGREIDDVQPFALPVFANSDNEASGSVIDLIGINRVNDYYRKIGLTSSAITNWNFGKSRTATNSPRALGGDNYLTAKDSITFLRGLHDDTILSPEKARTLREWMLLSPRKGSGGGWLGTLLPAGMRSTMQHKAGWLPPGCCSSQSLYNTLNEIGLLEVEPDHWIAVAILLHGGTDYSKQTLFMERASCVLVREASGEPLDCRD